MRSGSCDAIALYITSVISLLNSISTTLKDLVWNWFQKCGSLLQYRLETREYQWQFNANPTIQNIENRLSTSTSLIDDNFTVFLTLPNTGFKIDWGVRSGSLKSSVRSRNTYCSQKREKAKFHHQIYRRCLTAVPRGAQASKRDILACLADLCLNWGYAK